MLQNSLLAGTRVTEWQHSCCAGLAHEQLVVAGAVQLKTDMTHQCKQMCGVAEKAAAQRATGRSQQGWRCCRMGRGLAGRRRQKTGGRGRGRGCLGAAAALITGCSREQVAAFGKAAGAAAAQQSGMQVTTLSQSSSLKSSSCAAHLQQQPQQRLAAYQLLLLTLVCDARIPDIFCTCPLPTARGYCFRRHLPQE
jgi:hypothetical protein